MENKYLGMFFSFIKKEDIPFDTDELKDGDIIYNNNIGEELIYHAESKSYRLITNEQNVFLTNAGLTNWKKYNAK